MCQVGADEKIWVRLLPSASDRNLKSTAAAIVKVLEYTVAIDCNATIARLTSNFVCGCNIYTILLTAASVLAG